MNATNIIFKVIFKMGNTKTQKYDNLTALKCTCRPYHVTHCASAYQNTLFNVP